MSTIPPRTQDDRPDHGDIGGFSTPSEVDMSSSIRSRSNDSVSTKSMLKSWIRRQGKNSYSEPPMSQTLGSNLDTLHEKISTWAKIADKPGEASDFTEYDDMKREVERMCEVCTFVLKT